MQAANTFTIMTAKIAVKHKNFILYCQYRYNRYISKLKLYTNYSGLRIILLVEEIYEYVPDEINVYENATGERPSER